jgi:hypothetical protein
MRRTVPAGSLMGLVAFVVLMSAEVGLGAVCGRSLVDQLAAFTSSPGAIGRGAQVILPYSRSFRASGGRRRSEKGAALRTAAHSSTEAVQLLGSRHPFGSRFQQPETKPIWVWAKNRATVRAPQHKISHLAESFEGIWGVDGHEHVQIPGTR